jgi:XTP/dITP diphosphohydrolase
MELVIASNNKGKIKELKELISELDLLSLADVGFDAEIPEPFRTFAENAHTKAATIHTHCGKNVMADDSGICVHALGNEPGVDSAHYSGKRNDEENLQLVLQKLAPHADRSAHYKAVICLIWEGTTHYFEGVCQGTIVQEKRGKGGFGYDPIFVPDGYEQTFGELPAEVKNSISHRGEAVRKMVAFITSKLQQP